SLVENRPQGWPFATDPSIPTNISPVNDQLFSFHITDTVIRNYSPLVYLHSEENYFPSDVEHFLDHVSIESDHMNTIEPLQCEACSNLTFFSGFNPAENTNRTPVYALVVNKDQSIVDVFYFISIRLIWEKEFVLASNSHNFGVPVPWTSATVHSEFPTHPIAYCSDGSHGCYPTKGDYVYNQIANGESLTDRSDEGILWKTWENVVVLRVSKINVVMTLMVYT
ncbi:secreted sugar hydrolase, partial [Brachionus plicatilis]